MEISTHYTTADMVLDSYYGIIDVAVWCYV